MNTKPDDPPEDESNAASEAEEAARNAETGVLTNQEKAKLAAEASRNEDA
jgi:hypothetical protein